MARATQSVNDIIQEALGGLMSRLAPQIAKAIAEAAAVHLEGQLVLNGPAKKARVGSSRRRSPRVELTKWVADRNARRVPTFVIDLTGGLDTKKRIVAKYGENAVFEKGKPAPKPKSDSVKVSPDAKKPGKEAARVVSAR
jgi:hypothetical protein